MLALVTGATGCVGANVVEALLSNGYEVRALHRATSRMDALTGLCPEFVEGDILDCTSLKRAMEGCDIVFHVAAVSEYWRTSTKLIYRVNVEGTRNVLQVALSNKIKRVVFTSSVAVFGKPTYPGEIMTESSQFTYYTIPFHYGHSKLLAEAEVNQSVSTGLDVVIVNPASVIGQRDINYIGGEIIKAAKSGWIIAAPSGGMGVVSAKDVGLGHVLAAERGAKGARYILNGDNISHIDLLTTVAYAIGISPPQFIIPGVVGRGLAYAMHMLRKVGIHFRGIDPVQIYLSTYNMYFDGSKAVEELGFTPSSAHKSVDEAVNWYKRQGLL